jgi:polyhydroxybutyrate depolymerase
MPLRAIVILLAVASCSDPPVVRTKTFGGDRPVQLQTPATFDESKHYPLVVVLHGYGANGFVQAAYFGVTKLVTDSDAFVLAPDGLVDASGKQFWNADPACCDFGGLAPDDSGYIGGLIDAVEAEWPVDHHAVLVIGHSNGGYMAYRMACDRADVITSIAALAGVASSTPATCNPSQPVEVLTLHGSLDDTVPFTAAMPSALQWAAKDGCTGTFTPGPAFDLDATIDGAETTTQDMGGCPSGGSVALWTIQGAGHVPNLDASFTPTIWDWFGAHRRP